MTKNKRLRGDALAAATSGWATALVGAPFLAPWAGGAAGLVYLAGSLVCHQLPNRSFHVGGAQLPVCARCLALYVGAAAGVTAWAWLSRTRVGRLPRRQAVTALALSAIPTATSIVTAWIGVGDPPNAWRAALALPLGVVGGLMAGAAVSDHLK